MAPLRHDAAAVGCAVLTKASLPEPTPTSKPLSPERACPPGVTKPPPGRWSRTLSHGRHRRPGAGRAPDRVNAAIAGVCKSGKTPEEVLLEIGNLTPRACAPCRRRAPRPRAPRPHRSFSPTWRRRTSSPSPRRSATRPCPSGSSTTTARCSSRWPTRRTSWRGSTTSRCSPARRSGRPSRAARTSTASSPASRGSDDVSRLGPLRRRG